MLEKKTRINLVLEVERRLSALPLNAGNLILRTYGLESYDPTDDYGSSIQWIVESAMEGQLVELAQYFELDVPEGAAPESRIATVAVARPLFLFGSHLTDHRVLVGDTSRALKTYGIDLFVAHDSIEEDLAWQAEIEKALDRSDGGLAFLQEGFRDSKWCDQEVGWLLGRKVPVMAFCFDLNPYGFFGPIQGQKVPAGTTAQEIAEMTIDRILTKQPELLPGLSASLVAAMASSPNFATTDAIWKRLRELNTLDADLCSQLLDAVKTNTQIYWAYSPWDGGEGYRRVVANFLLRQPGANLIASDIEAYVSYLGEEDAESHLRIEEARRRLEEARS